MRLEHYSPERLKKEIIAIIGKYLDICSYKVFFFGSRVTGRGNERSDIDVGIEGPVPLSPVLLSNIKEEIEDLPILYKIEIVDFKNVSQDFRGTAFQCTESLN